MTHLHDQLAAIQREGASTFSTSSLAKTHGHITRRVRRDRVVRTGIAAVAGVGVAGAGTFGVLQLRGADALVPMGSPSPSVTDSIPEPSSSPTPHSSGQAQPGESFVIEPGEFAVDVIDRVAQTHEVTDQQARDAIGMSLPAEAEGQPEGWLAVGEHPSHLTLTQQADNLVRSTQERLESADVPREQWQETLIIASILEAETSNPDDMGALARVIRNRLDEGIRLEIDSPLYYYAHALDLSPSDDGWDMDVPYNTFRYEGLPPTPINSPSMDAINAAADPSEGDWLYFARDESSGELLFSTTFREHQEILVELGMIEPEDVL